MTHTQQYSIDVHLQQNEITYLTILKEEHPGSTKIKLVKYWLQSKVAFKSLKHSLYHRNDSGWIIIAINETPEEIRY